MYFFNQYRLKINLLINNSNKFNNFIFKKKTGQ